jgi:purine-binding chemotaxis protein CheW
MSYTTINSPRLSSNNLIAESRLKFIAFKVINSWFALPIEAVLKIIPCPPIDGEIRECLGLVEWERQTITIIDLAQKLQPSKSSTLSTKNVAKSSLILVQTNSAELCGFLCNQDITLINIDPKNISSIPSSYRQVAEFGVISKIATLPQEEGKESLKLFLLGQ